MTRTLTEEEYDRLQMLASLGLSVRQLAIGESIKRMIVEGRSSVWESNGALWVLIDDTQNDDDVLLEDFLSEVEKTNQEES
jgi:hypothetical protein